jgi:hypothetical protein
MKNQHTPGPWLRSKSGNTFQIVAGKDMNEEPNTLVANIPPIGYNCDYEPCDETKANAHLIASAPDLLSALIALEKASRKVLDTSATHDGLENCKTLLEARVAIQKAKGEA